MTQRRTINPKGVFDSLRYGFSQALLVESGRRLLLSGQVGVDAEERTVEGGIGAQAAQAFVNIQTLLREAGGDLSHVVMLRIYIAESAKRDQGPIADVLRRTFPRDPPPSSWIIVTALARPEWLIEIEAEAQLS